MELRDGSSDHDGRSSEIFLPPKIAQKAVWMTAVDRASFNQVPRKAPFAGRVIMTLPKVLLKTCGDGALMAEAL
jgi:hypothetical protein